MNVPAIRSALLACGAQRWRDALHIAVVRVGLRACDEYESDGCPGCKIQVEFLADILREAGVEVEG